MAPWLPTSPRHLASLSILFRAVPEETRLKSWWPEQWGEPCKRDHMDAIRCVYLKQTVLKLFCSYHSRDEQQRYNCMSTSCVHADHMAFRSWSRSRLPQGLSPEEHCALLYAVLLQVWEMSSLLKILLRCFTFAQHLHFLYNLILISPPLLIFPCSCPSPHASCTHPCGNLDMSVMSTHSAHAHTPIHTCDSNMLKKGSAFITFTKIIRGAPAPPKSFLLPARGFLCQLPCRRGFSLYRELLCDQSSTSSARLDFRECILNTTCPVVFSPPYLISRVCFSRQNLSQPPPRKSSILWPPRQSSRCLSVSAQLLSHALALLYVRFDNFPSELWGFALKVGLASADWASALPPTQSQFARPIRKFWVLRPVPEIERPLHAESGHVRTWDWTVRAFSLRSLSNHFFHPSWWWKTHTHTHTRARTHTHTHERPLLCGLRVARTVLYRVNRV